MSSSVWRLAEDVVELSFVAGTSCAKRRYFGGEALGFIGFAREATMLGIIAIILVVLWALGFFAFHVTAAFVHVLLVIALVLVVLHFLRGRGI